MDSIRIKSHHIFKNSLNCLKLLKKTLNGVTTATNVLPEKTGELIQLNNK